MVPMAPSSTRMRCFSASWSAAMRAARVERGWSIAFSLAAFVERPQADDQIGACNPIILREIGERGAGPGDDRLPIAEALLAEKPRRGVPRTVAAIEEPTPVGREGQQDPDGLAQRAREVRHGGIHRDDEVELLDEAGGVC